MKHYKLAYTILFGSILMTGLVTFELYQRDAQKEEIKFLYLANEQIHYVREAVNDTRDILDAITSFYDASEFVSREEFGKFAGSLLKKNPEVDFLAWIPVVPSDARQNFVDSAKADGLTNFDFMEKDKNGLFTVAAQKPEYYPVFYIEPYEKNATQVGLDLKSDQILRHSFEEVNAGNDVAMTARVRLGPENSRNSYAVMLIRPVHQQGGEIKGYVAGVYKISDIMAAIVDHMKSSHISVFLYDVTSGEKSEFLYAYREEAGSIGSTDEIQRHELNGLNQISERFMAGTREWEVIMVDAGPMISFFGPGTHWMALVLGLIFSFGLFISVLLLLRYSDRNERLMNEAWQASEALKESEAWSRSIVETANDAFVGMDLGGGIIAWNRKAEEMFGWSLAEVKDKPLTEHIIPPQYRKAHQEGLKRFIQTGEGPVLNQRIEITAIGKSGNEFPVELTIWPVKKGDKTTFNAFIHDITQRKKAQEELKTAYEKLKRTQSQLVQQDRLTAMGHLAAGVAHEINNPIGFIKTNIGVLDKYLKSFNDYYEVSQGSHKDGKLEEILEDTKSLIEESRSGLDRVIKIVSDLKTFARVGGEGMEMADLHKVLDGILNIVANEIKYKADVKKEYGDVPKIYCNHQELGQVFINMLVNASHAMPGDERGVITLRTYTEELNVCIEIEDTGSGIPEDVIPNIYDPFFTTKEVGRGTGLGLSISFDIVKKHEGTIDVVSSVGKGTKFTIRLPIACPVPPKK